MTPNRKYFWKFFPIRIEGTWIDVLWPNLVKIGHWEVAEKWSGLPHRKKRAPLDSPEPPTLPRWTNRAQNFLNVVAT